MATTNSKWVVSQLDLETTDAEHPVAIYDTDGNHVATAEASDDTEANAHMIAAAPAMLKALQKAEKRLTFLLEGCVDDGADPDWKALRAVRAVIAKAEAK